MSKFMVDLSEEHREALEAIRRNRGHRSHADTIRELILQAASSGPPAPEVQEQIRASATAAQARSRGPEKSPPGMKAQSVASILGLPVGNIRPALQKGGKR